VIGGAANTLDIPCPQTPVSQHFWKGPKCPMDTSARWTLRH